MRFSVWTLLSLFALALAIPVPEVGPRNLGERETALNAFLTILLDNIPVLDGTISAVAGILTVFENLLVNAGDFRENFQKAQLGPNFIP